MRSTCSLWLVIALSLGSSVRAGAALPEDLRAIVEENSRSLAALETFSAELELRAEFWRDGQPMRFRETLLLTVSGSKVREDRSGTLDAVDLPQLITTKAGDEELAITPPAPRRSIITTNFRTAYTVGSDRMAIVAGIPSSPFGAAGELSEVHEYLSVFGTPLEKKVRDLAARDDLPKVSDGVIDGDRCRLLEWKFPAAKMKLRIWTATEFGHLIKRIVTVYDGRTTRDWTTVLSREKAGCFLRAVDDQECRPSDGQLRSHRVLTVKSVQWQPKLDDTTFTLQGLGVPPGTLVQDRISGTEYRIGP